MTHTSRPQTVLYLAGSEATAREGAAALEAVPSGRERTVYPLSTASAGRPSTWVVDVDCVVFAETPTTASGASLLEVSEACGETPLVLFTDAAYAPRAAHATDGVDGYVRKGTDDAVSHLADEIEWICQDAAGSEPSDAFRAAFDALPEPALRYERVDDRLLVRAVSDSFVDVFAIDRETLVDNPIDGDEGVAPPGLEGQRAVLSDMIQSAECRQFDSRHDTATGVRTFQLTVVPCSPAATDRRADGLVIYSDVTDETQQAQTLAATLSRLETVADVLEDDVRTLLHVAESYLAAADRTGTRAQFEAVEEAQTQLRERVDDLASIARRDEGIGKLEPVAIHDLARRVWATIAADDARLVTPEETDRILEADKKRLCDLFEQRFRTVLEHERDGGAQNGVTVVVRSTDDGFAISSHSTNSVPAAGDGGLETVPVPESLATADGTGTDSGPVERIADAHGWTVASTSNETGTVVVFSGVDDAEIT
ncbi:HAMP domain-containing histidine kinase [Natronorubrum sulfidifaciens]|uniref:Phytochrome sensor protein n=1 Tax=Natronorubrum sulfidifaciens JCM 14089 TaxID=1230460 RepID=L9W9E2_9EURY|nr:HAMP domain-containing histidine kinase [Natronorubrum sulfidifaciens]ELY46095.1 phytochrome sensor protein [Natronorubrum sulfidifaciens JCM 14089]